MDAFASHGRTFLASLPLIARSPAADFAKPVNGETVLLSCNSADRVPKPVVSHNAIDLLETAKHSRL